MHDCVFCNIVNNVIDKELLYEDDAVVAFHDILPKAPVHIQIISKEHIPSIAALTESQKDIPGKMVWAAKQVAEKFKIDQTGYRLIFHVGKDGGQVILHLHLHLMGGKKLPE